MGRFGGDGDGFVETGVDENHLNKKMKKIMNTSVGLNIEEDCNKEKISSNIFYVWACATFLVVTLVGFIYK